MNEATIHHAKMWAGMHHKGQVRKYTGEPYIEHPEAVAELVREAGLSDIAITAAILHDTVEDTGATMEDIEELFGDKVAEYVWYLTKPPVFVGDRPTRKEHDRWRLSLAPEEVKIIKFFDIYHNASSIKEHDPEKWMSWSAEMTLLLLAMDVRSIPTLAPYDEFMDSL
jgi:(p)ppGpp synthase/HD superfamily hydrolase